MLSLFQPGDVKTFTKTVQQEDCAAFFDEVVHPLYATFALARDIEWCCRLFVLDMKEDDEEGIGTFIHVEHLSPALVHTIIHFTATIESIREHEIICHVTVTANDRLLARARQGQKILKKSKLMQLYRDTGNDT